MSNPKYVRACPMCEGAYTVGPHLKMIGWTRNNEKWGIETKKSVAVAEKKKKKKNRTKSQGGKRGVREGGVFGDDHDDDDHDNVRCGEGEEGAH